MEARREDGRIIGDHGRAALCANFPGAIDETCRYFCSTNVDANDYGILLHLCVMGATCSTSEWAIFSQAFEHSKTFEYYTTYQCLG